jgi:VWFA-related protein
VPRRGEEAPLRTRFALSLLPLTFLLVAATPRQPDIPRLGEMIEVSIVNVDVFVTDKHGNRVHGLTKDDFEIVEDRKPQPITNFSEYGPVVTNEHASVDAAAGDVPRMQQAPPQKRTMVLFVDRFFLPSFNRDPLFARLKEMLHKTVRPGDAVMVVSWDRGMRVRQQFTDDVTALDHAIDGIAHESGLPKPDLYTQNLNDQADFDAFSQTLNRAAAAKGFRGNVIGSTPPGQKLALLQALWEVKQKVYAMNALITMISGVEGKKTFFYASHRMGRIAGAEVLFTNGGSYISPEIRAEFDTGVFIEKLMKNANANGVTIYTIYPEGLGNDSMPGADKSVAGTATYDYDLLNNEISVLSDIAVQTGGQMAYGTDVVKLLPHVEEDFESYYSLGYRATTSNQNRAHTIVVKTRNRDYIVRSRREFVEKTDDAKMNDRVVANLFQAPGGSIIPVKVDIGRHTPLKGKYTVPISVRIPIASLTTVPQSNTNAGAFSVYVTSSSRSRGTIGDVTHRTQRYDIPPNQVTKARQGFFTYDLQVLVDGGVDRLSVGVFDEVSREFGFTAVDLPRAVHGTS